MARKPDDLIDLGDDQATKLVEEALFEKARGGCLDAIEIWLYNRAPERWHRTPRRPDEADPKPDPVEAEAQAMLRELESGTGGESKA